MRNLNLISDLTRGIAIGAAAFSLWAAAASAAAQDAFAIGTVPADITSIGPRFAEAAGTFASNRIKVEIVTVEGGSRGVQVLLSGKLQAMPASYTTEDERFRVIRPLIEFAEADIARFASLEGYPILPCNLCGSQSGLKRDAMAALLTKLEVDIPDLRHVMAAALTNVRPSHLLDRTLISRLGGEVSAARLHQSPDALTVIE